MIEQEMLDFVSAFLDVALIYFIVYRLLLIIKGTRAVPMLIALMAIALMYGVSEEGFLNLPTFHWVLEQFIGSLLIIVVVLFQADIRRALAAFGQTQFLSSMRSGSDAQVIDELVKATTSLAGQRIGALIVVEREADLAAYEADGTRLDAKLSKELLYSLFVPERQSPLHDGAVVIRNGRIAAAGVFLPMSVNPQMDRALGTRHRAAVGLSEETDALVLVVSEERGTISLAHDGELELDISQSHLRATLTHLLIRRSGRLFRKNVAAGDVLEEGSADLLSKGEDNSGASRQGH